MIPLVGNPKTIFCTIPKFNKDVILRKSYLKIYILTIIPAAVFFISNLEGSKETAVFLLFGGFFLTFLNWKKDSDSRVKDFINRVF